jgi:hypothetical protein
MKRRAVFAVAALLAACTAAPAPTPQQSKPVPYFVPIDAAKQEMSGWTEQQVRACLGAPLDSDVVAGLPRYRFQRGSCTEHVIFKDGKVLSVEGYGDVQACWWVVNACEEPSASQPAAPRQRPTAWRTWSRDDVVACFGEPTPIMAEQPNSFRVARDGCTIEMDIDNRRYLFMHQWTESEKGACRRLVNRCDATLPTSPQ